MVETKMEIPTLLLARTAPQAGDISPETLVPPLPLLKGKGYD